MMLQLPDIRNEQVDGKRVLIRADLNVPMDTGRITDLTRIERFAPSVRDLLARGSAVVIMTHLGRPAGEPNPHYSTQPLADALRKILNTDVAFCTSMIGNAAESITSNLKPSELAILENLRFHKGETDNARNFAIQLSVHGDCYVNDAFSCSHRAHASIDAITQFLPSYAGSSLIAEVEALNSVLESPERPVAALVGGSKISTKIAVLKNLVSKVDHLIVGGGMANTFLAARGHDVGQSLTETDALGLASQILDKAGQTGCNIVLPNDVVVARSLSENVETATVPASSIPADMMALDVGPQSCSEIESVLEKSKTLLWNGPLGAFEVEPFGAATFSIARKAADLTQTGRLKTIAGGGDTVAALNAASATDRFSYVSTAGGAFLEWLEGKQLPGIAALTNPKSRQEVL